MKYFLLYLIKVIALKANFAPISLWPSINKYKKYINNDLLKLHF